MFQVLADNFSFPHFCSSHDLGPQMAESRCHILCRHLRSQSRYDLNTGVFGIFSRIRALKVDKQVSCPWAEIARASSDPNLYSTGTGHLQARCVWLPFPVCSFCRTLRLGSQLLVFTAYPGSEYGNLQGRRPHYCNIAALAIRIG